MATRDYAHQVKLGKSCGIEGVTELTDRIKKALASSNRLEFDLSEVSDLELPVIQVLYASARSATQAGGGILLTGTLQPSVRTRLIAAGFSKTLEQSAQALQSSLPGFSSPGADA